MRVPRTRPLNPRACVKTGARGGGLQAQGCETVSGGLSARDVNCFSSFAESPFAWNSGRDAPTSLWKGGVAGTHPLCPGEDYFISGLPEAALGLLESLGLDPGPAAGTGGGERPGVSTEPGEGLEPSPPQQGDWVGAQPLRASPARGWGWGWGKFPVRGFLPSSAPPLPNLPSRGHWQLLHRECATRKTTSEPACRHGSRAHTPQVPVTARGPTLPAPRGRGAGESPRIPSQPFLPSLWCCR